MQCHLMICNAFQFELIDNVALKQVKGTCRNASFAEILLSGILLSILPYIFPVNSNVS